MNEITKGPWHVESRTVDEDLGYSVSYIKAGNGKEIATVYLQCCQPNDARLLAAAPELLEALEYASKYMKVNKGKCRELTDLIKRVKGEEDEH